jgi:Na+/H+-translocating membrane pyrophosphatase
MGGFIVVFGIIIFVVVDQLGQEGTIQFRFYAWFAYVVGSLTSMLCGWIGMSIAVKANFRCTFQAV